MKFKAFLTSLISWLHTSTWTGPEISTRRRTPALPRDIQAFLDDYPDNDVEQNEELSANLEFYLGSRRCEPDNLLIEEIHDCWFGDYNKLERKHGFIQWLFPIQEYGVNYASQPLQRHEIRFIRDDLTIIERILQSYRLVLDFYGMRLASVDTGLVERALSPTNYAARYRNLARSTHNNLRITRILKCLSEIGLERLNAGFLLHVLNEQSEAHELDSYAIRSSMDRWWANCIRDAEERAWIGRTIRRVRAGDEEFVFTREMYRDALERRRAGGSLGSELEEAGSGSASSVRRDVDGDR